VGVVEAVSGAVQTVLPGLSLSKMRADIAETLRHMGAMGAHELGAVLYTGSGFVMYPKAGKEQSVTMDGLRAEARAKEQEQGRDAQEKERGREV
jgi:hypothetical protein